VASKSWSFAHNRRVIELAKTKTSLGEAARIMERTPERIRKVATRLGVKFKAEGKTKKDAWKRSNIWCPAPKAMAGQLPAHVIQIWHIRCTILVAGFLGPALHADRVSEHIPLWLVVRNLT
jgi:hypothetical protein